VGYFLDEENAPVYFAIWRKAMKKMLVSLLVAFCFSVSVFAQDSTATISLALVNYLATEARIIMESTGNRLMLKNVYDRLINNIDKRRVDEEALQHFLSMMDTIHRFDNNATARERLQYLFERQQAQAILSAVPSPLAIMGTVHIMARDGLAAGIASVIGITASSVLNYQKEKNQTELEYLQKFWDLEDQEKATLHELRKDMFAYGTQIANRYNVKGVVSESDIDDFVKYKIGVNKSSRLSYLEANRSKYISYPPYYLTLADTYYEFGRFQDCINAIEQYEKSYIPIFTINYDYAETLTRGVVALSEVYKDNPNLYVQKTNDYLTKIANNTNSESQWLIRYFVAVSYLDLLSLVNNDTARRQYLTNAYNLLEGNIRQLAGEQNRLQLLTAYSNPVNATVSKFQDSIKKNLFNED
jgi:hypothetical protein